MKNYGMVPVLLCLILGFSSQAWGATYPLNEGEDVVGETFVIALKPGDSLESVAAQYDMSLHEILEANPTLATGPLKVRQKVVIPARFVLPNKAYRKRGGIVINTSELRLYYFSQDGQYVMTYPVALGRRGWRTPTTSAKVVRKAVNPDWHVSKSIKRYHYNLYGKWLPDVIRGGSGQNPLGSYALYLSQKGILVHGTNYPTSIGKFVTSGCIRLSPSNIATLYHKVRVGAPVYIVHHVHKAGWSGGHLYLESHEPVTGRGGQISHASYEKAIKEAVGKRSAEILWDKATQVGSQKNGVPQLIGRLVSDASL